MKEGTHPNPNNSSHRTPPCLQHRLDIPTAQRRLLRHGPLDQLAVRVGGELACDPDLRGGGYGLGVGACC